MRTTVVLKDELVARAKKLSKEKTLSGILNTCLADWIRQQNHKQMEARLVLEYRKGSAESKRVSRDFAAVDQEGWPQEANPDRSYL